jgi:glycosyltransferase involved in cell wall biosynthesis
MLIESDNIIQNPLVSVFIITYTQEKTVTQTIESILAQEGDYTLELIIGDDASQDDTPNICCAYQKKYPDKIRVLLQEKNQGVVKNYIDTLRLCRGDFVAVCAGDDYWCDAHKIQKQLQFLTNNPDHGVVSTGGYKLLVEQDRLISGIAPLNPPQDGNVFDLTWRGGVYAMPLSLLIRAELIEKIDFDEFIRRKFSVEDVPFQAILAKLTKFGHIPDLCVVYRVYTESLTFTNFNSPRYLSYHEGLVAIRRYLFELYPEDVEFSEQWAHDYLVYRKFLQAVHAFDYRHAKFMLTTLQEINKKEKRALLLTKTQIGFYIFALVKRWKLKRSVNIR